MGLPVTELMKKLLFCSIRLKYLELISNKLARISNTVNDEIRKRTAGYVAIPDIHNFDRTEKLKICVLEEKTPWADRVCETSGIPGMITKEECQYYSYIGQFYSGKGEVVELGPWLGNSTLHILKGLEDNPNWTGRKLHVYDDFVWRDWMNKWVTPEERLEVHQDFSALFDKYASKISSSIIKKKNKIVKYDGNDDVPDIIWSGRPVEIIYVDCGRTFEVNDAWFKIFSGSFIPDTTLVIMQDWRLHREIPYKWYNQTKQFTDSKGAGLQLIHELCNGGIATFLYRGR